MPKAKPHVLELAGREVAISNPDKPYFAALGVTKLDLVRYYVAVADGALRGVRGRPPNRSASSAGGVTSSWS